MNDRIGVYVKRFEEIKDMQLTSQRRGEMLGALMTRIEVENGGLNAVINGEAQLAKVYGDISKARWS